MPHKPGALLVAEIGNVTTRVTLVDLVDGEMRLIGQASVPSTTEPPFENAVIGILEAASQLSETTGRQLMHDGSLLMPQTNERDGVNSVVALTSASPPMSVVVAAVASEMSARSATRASRPTYTTLLQTITLDDAAGASPDGDHSWIERQVQTLMGLRPDVVIIAGGLEDGAQDALVRLAHIVGLTALTTRVDSDGQPRQDINKRRVIFAGNSYARERVIEALSSRADLQLVDNVRPTLDAEQLTPMRQMLTKLYNEALLPLVPGAPALRRISSAPLASASDAAGLMTRFVAEHYHRATLAIDCGSANTALYLAEAGRYTPMVFGAIGSGYGLGGLLAERGAAAIARWLPFAISERELTHWLLNKMLRPQTIPASRDDVLIEQAVAREALALALAELQGERTATYDYVVAGGGVLANAPHPGLAALTILDALQPSADESVLAIELHLDTLGLLAACGALAASNPDAALTLFERDLLRNTPLATCVVALGSGRLGEPAVEAELREVGGAVQRVTVAHGQIGRLALAPNRKAQLMLRPIGNVRIGRNAPGEEVASDVAAISGSALGVVIDARGRPLRLPDEPAGRQKLLWEWLVAVGAEQGPLPYPIAEVIADAPVSISPATPTIAFADASASAPGAANGAPEAPATLERDLAKLRQSIEEPKKGGFLRRKR
ncbi:MAG TPA: glutamate mutase L [Kouleothrix sp.]|uniref:glutamate mutase L n=1 Tax=Kouleothrix sp. TaxID=2779161 RepID=UPI002C7B31C3|nr:glutamate mutase L [Kouleothrix sp.]